MGLLRTEIKELGGGIGNFFKKYSPGVRGTRMVSGYDAAKQAEKDAKKAGKMQKEQKSLIEAAQQREELRLAESESDVARRRFRARSSSGRSSLLGG